MEELPTTYRFDNILGGLITAIFARKFKAAVGRSRMQRQQGFSLIELLIVVAIILIICAIAIPSFLRSKITADEAAAVGSLRAIINAENTYIALYASVGYSVDLLSIAGTSCVTPTSSSACFIDDTLAQATSPGAAKSGYYFTYSRDSSVGYTVQANPASSTTGVKHYYTDASGVIRYNNGATATINDPAIQ